MKKKYNPSYKNQNADIPRGEVGVLEFVVAVTAARAVKVVAVSYHFRLGECHRVAPSCVIVQIEPEGLQGPFCYLENAAGLHL